MKDGYGIFELAEVHVESEGVAEGFPLLVPDSCVSSALGPHDPGEDFLLDSAEITAELIAGLRWRKRQDLLCGY